MLALQGCRQFEVEPATHEDTGQLLGGSFDADGGSPDRGVGQGPDDQFATFDAGFEVVKQVGIGRNL